MKVRALCGYNLDAAHKMGMLFLMYISQKVFLTFTWTLLPIILRQQKISLSTIGFTALVYSPWALKFLYAPVVDRCFSMRIGRRKSWIIPLLGLSWLLLIMVGFLSLSQDLPAILIIVFLLNWMFATIDIAVDGYATDILSSKERPWGNATQLIAYMLGYMLGAGVFIIVYQYYGWQTTVWIIAVLQLLIMSPIMFHVELPAISSKNEAGNLTSDKSKPNIIKFLSKPSVLWLILLLIIIAVLDQGSSQLRLPMFVDLGVTPTEFGQINIWVGTPIFMIGALLGGAIYQHFGARIVFIISCISVAIINILTAAAAMQPTVSFWLAATILGSDKLIFGVIGLLTSSMIMRKSIGSQSATNYAVLSSVGHIFQFSLMPLVGYICDLSGYTRLYIGLVVTSVMALLIGNYLFKRKLVDSSI